MKQDDIAKENEAIDRERANDQAARERLWREEIERANRIRAAQGLAPLTYSN